MSLTKTMKSLSRLLVAVLLLGPAIAFADYDLNMTQGVTEISREVYGIHMLVLWIVTIVGIAVFAVMIYSIIKHRKSKGAKAAHFHESTTVEVIWTIIPFVILVALAVPATKIILKMDNMEGSEINIKVTAHQWYWEYEYLETGLKFNSRLAKDSEDARKLKSGADVSKVENYLLNVDKPMTVPKGKKVRLLITSPSNDVIHAWWVPALSVKKDAVPGYIRQSWFKTDKEGTYRGQCAELCGKDHGFMPIVVNVVSDEKYAQWTEETKKIVEEESKFACAAETCTKDELMQRGEKVYATNCAACHQASGMGGGPFPALKGSKIATGPVEDHIKIVVKGKNAMPPFAATLSDADLAAVITFERNAWGNNKGDMAQPSQVKAAR